MHTVSWKIHIRFSFLVERWFAACSQLCSRRLSRGSRFTTQIATLPVLPCPLISSRLQYTSLTSFLVCLMQHVLPTTSSNFCYFFLWYLLILGGIEHEILCLLHAEIGLIALGMTTPLFFFF